MRNLEKESYTITNSDSDTVIKRLYLYYDMKLVTFGFDEGINSTVHGTISCFYTAKQTKAIDSLPN